MSKRKPTYASVLFAVFMNPNMVFYTNLDHFERAFRITMALFSAFKEGRGFA